jgi:uncharacterized protein (DUF2267 family)
VLEAARALENNNIGAIVVQEKGCVAGIVTDRDLAVRVVGRSLDPNTTMIGEVMTSPVATLSPDDSQSAAIQLMKQRNVRRIPLVDEEGRLVGIVTLDDLLLDEAAPLDKVADVVESQIGAGGPTTSLRAPSARRRAERAIATYGRLLNRLWTTAELASTTQAEAALLSVLEPIVRRLTPDEAEDLIAQLPSLIQPTLRVQASGPDKSITRESIEAELIKRVGVAPDRAAELLSVVGAAIAQAVSPGQIQDVQGQLPEKLRDIFSTSSFVSA